MCDESNRCAECGKPMPADYTKPVCSQECLDKYMDGMQQEFEKEEE